MAEQWIRYYNIEGGDVFYNLQSGETVPIYSKAEGERVGVGAFYPDGHTCVVTRMNYNLRDNLARKLRPRYYKTDLLTGEETELFTAWDRSDVQLCNVCFLPNGYFFISASNTEKGGTQIFIVDETGRDKQEIWSSKAYPYGFNFSPDGKYISYHCAGHDDVYNPCGHYAINVMNIDGTNQRMLHSEAGHLCFNPTWSRDGQYLAFQDCQPPLGDPGHMKADVAIMRPDGSDFKRLTSHREQYFATSFGLKDYRSGGSNCVIFAADGRIIHSQMSEGAQHDAYFDPEKRDHEEWTYDPKVGKGSCPLVLLNPADGSVEPITEREEGKWDFRASLSKDGSQLLYTTYRFGSVSEIHWHDMQTGEDRFISRGLNDHGVDHPYFVNLPDEIVRKIAIINK